MNECAVEDPRKIRVLDEATIANIAAGEVIERPVSVVKELVENSLDAGAKNIAVEVVDGGRALISVADDGAGIPVEDLPLALARHATSKLATVDDLLAVRTLGFRGEGLASIAAAGQVDIVSRVQGAEFGARVEAQGTWIGQPAQIAAPPGTKVVVRDLFATIPARRRFLKGQRAEFARISAYLSQLALGWPDVGFSLRHDGRGVWALPPVSDRVDRLEMVFGADARGTLVPVELEAAGLGVNGYVSAPGHDRPNRNQQTFFVNHRLVRGAALTTAWLSGAGTFVMTGRFPYGVLMVEMEPRGVDINVHPTKIEVRFADAAEVFEAVRAAVAQALQRVEPAREMPVSAFQPRSSSEEALSPATFAAGAWPVGASPTATFGGGMVEAVPEGARVLGQIDRTYVVVREGDQLLVIDQHAAHERTAYEALQRSSIDAADKPANQPQQSMLFPTVLELTPQQVAALHEFAQELMAAGVSVEEFGDGAYRLSALPAGYVRRRFDLARMLDELAAGESARDGRTPRDRVLAAIACHSVVRAHEPLSLQEQATLYERLLQCREPHVCPHGRPTMLRLNAASLEKAFRRT